MKKHRQVVMEKKISSSKDMLEIEGVCFGRSMKLILVYFDVDKGPAGRARNEKMREEVEEKMKRNESDLLVILGEFNGHLSVLEGRRDDVNGKMLREWVIDYNLTLMNADRKCEGIYTRTRGEEKSAIDMVLMNRGRTKFVEV